MIVISRRKFAVFILFLVCAIIAAAAPQKKEVRVFSQRVTKRIVIDAGHGFPDGGAVSQSGTVESVLNLKIALYTCKMLEKKGYTVIMTRKGNDCLSEEGKSYSQKKKNDMKKRLEIINNSKSDIFISIHINKFSDSRYNGPQVIYSDNYVQSEALAGFIQKRLHLLDTDFTKRDTIKSDRDIYLLKNAAVPAVLVECGFLSNFKEEQLLITDSYQKELADAITKGIEDYYDSL